MANVTVLPSIRLVLSIHNETDTHSLKASSRTQIATQQGMQPGDKASPDLRRRCLIGLLWDASTSQILLTFAGDGSREYCECELWPGWPSIATSCWLLIALTRASPLARSVLLHLLGGRE